MHNVAKKIAQQEDLFLASLDGLRDYVGNELTAVNQLLLTKMDSRVPLATEIAGHLINAGGKRLRPLLTLATAKLCGYEGPRHVALASCIEFIHTATLLHDDVIDESVLRRGAPSSNALWDNKASVLVGDFLFSRAFELMVADESAEVMKILSSAASTIIEGEILQLVASNDVATTEDAYLEVISAKTAKLFAAACHIGGVITDSNNDKCKALENFGFNLGIAFQLIDDILDYTACQDVMGKPLGDDFREGKLTLPVILAYAQGTADEQQFWQRTINDLAQEDSDLETATGLIQQHNILEQIVDRAYKFAQKAADELECFSDSVGRQVLLDIASSCILRTS